MWTYLVFNKLLPLLAVSTGFSFLDLNHDRVSRCEREGTADPEVMRRGSCTE